MSEVQSRPSAPRGGRGSSTHRGRGGFSRPSRGRGGHAANGESIAATSIDENDEVIQLKRKYGDKFSTLHDMFPQWADVDVVMALQETGGDLELTVEGITEGTISQWGEVSNTKKDRSKSKAQDSASPALVDSTNQGRASRGGRGGFDAGRGGRGRGNERGRAPRGRGASAANAHTNGTRAKENHEISVPTTESSAWDTQVNEEIKPAAEVKNGEDSWGTAATSTAPSTTATTATSIIPDGVKKSWASMFAPAPKPKKAPEPVVEIPVEPAKPEEPAEVPEAEPEPSIPEPEPVEIAEPVPIEPVTIPETEIILTPSKDELTETNLEQVPGSPKAPTATAASTAASSWDPRNAPGTPYSALQQSTSRPPTSGYQASALKATGPAVRTPSFQRRVLDQEEAVRMPGNREVDRAAVQFGAFNLNGTGEGEGEDDVDGDREEPETRAQPPQHSPVAHPRATLPPAPQQPAPVPETFPTPKQTAGLPATSHPAAAPGLPSPQTLPTPQAQQVPQAAAPYGGRFAQPGVQDQSSLPQKPYDAFSQQAPAAQSPFDGYANQQSQAQPPQAGAISSAPGEYSQYYTADQQQQRNAYNSYYQQQYGLQQGAQGQQDGSAPQRSYSGYNGPQAEGAQFPQTSAQQPQARYIAGEGQTSGHTTPNPVTQTQQQTPGQTAPQPGHPQQPQAGNYPYGHPYYTSPYYTAYMNQYQQYGAGNYAGGPYGGKAGIHNQPYQGYMSPGAPYDHTSSPAASGFGSLHGRDSALGGGLSDYGRAGSAQTAQTPQALGGSGPFGGAQDSFGRGGSYPGQNQHYNGPQGNQPGAGDDLKPFGDSKTANGPSPSLSQAGRPGSATNAAPGSVLPPPQSQQGGYGGYPSHLQQQGQHGLHGSQAGSYGGLGGAGGHQAAGQGHQSSQYGGYQGFGGNYYGNSQQQRGGWGGNYGH